jgi:catechol 2,3-dioxygenase-like lactoylglutathione lyase family enzyme
MTPVLKLQHTSVPMPPGSAQLGREFYADVLGMKEITPPTALSDLDLAWFQAGDGDEVHLFADADMQTKSVGQHLCLQVESIDDHRARFNEAGVAIEETTAITNRPRFFVKDPFGNLLEIVQITGDFD